MSARMAMDEDRGGQLITRHQGTGIAPLGEPGIGITIIPGSFVGEMAELARAAGWEVKPSLAAAADLEAALQAGAAGCWCYLCPLAHGFPAV